MVGPMQTSRCPGSQALDALLKNLPFQKVFRSPQVALPDHSGVHRQARNSWGQWTLAGNPHTQAWAPASSSGAAPCHPP